MQMLEYKKGVSFITCLSLLILVLNPIVVGYDSISSDEDEQDTFYDRGSGLLFEKPEKEKIVDQIIPVSPEVDIQKNGITAVDNSQFLPPVGDQGSQNSCVAWAMGYYHHGYQETKEHGWDNNLTANQMSPASTYNYINGGVDQGAYFSDAAEAIINMGNPTMSDMPYDQADHTSWPDTVAAYNGLEYRADDYHWLYVGDDPGVDNLKQHLNNGNTAMLGIYIWDNFYNIDSYGNTYCVADMYGSNHGGHGVCVVGYNDSYPTNDGLGAFRCVNSWGTSWGDNGFFWMSYTAVKSMDLSQRWAIYLDDKIDYHPSLVSTVKPVHIERGEFMAYGIEFGLGSESSPDWTKTFLDYRKFYDDFKAAGNEDQYQTHTFPVCRMVFDLTDGRASLNPGGTQEFIGLNDSISADSGRVSYFDLHDFDNKTSSVSSETPVNVPDGQDSRTYVHLTLSSTPGLHGPIRIDSDDEFYELSGVFSGEGTEADPYLINGLEIDGTGYGYCIYIGNTTDHFRIDDCYLHNASGRYDPPDFTNSAVILRNTGDGEVSGCSLSDNLYDGVYVTQTNRIQISNNTIDDNMHAAKLTNSLIISLHNNTLINNGITIFGSTVAYWNRHNIPTTNTLNGRPIYYYANMSSGSIPTDAGQAIVVNCDSVDVSDLTLDNGTNGITLGFSNNCSVSDNSIIDHNNKGVYLYNSENISVRGNQISSNAGYGVQLDNSDRNTVSNNTAIGCDSNGLFVYVSDRNEMINNTIRSNQATGVYFYLADYNTFRGNTIENSSSYGIVFSSSNHNMIYHNNFIDNQVNNSNDNGNNIWNASYPEGGNYWSDYTGSDLYSGPDQNQPGSDGIGDSSRAIGGGGGNVDNYPLMNRYHMLDIRCEAGWNFISYNGYRIDTSLISLLDDTEDGIAGSYDRVMWYDAGGQLWRSYVPGRADHLNSMDNWNRSMGIWVHMTSDDHMRIGGQEYTDHDITLQPGWNMVGYPSDTDELANSTLPSEVTKIGVFNGSDHYNIEYIYDLSTYTMRTGEGYWVYNSAGSSVIWTVDF